MVPFHNLFYLGLCHAGGADSPTGGTCSDKVLAFRDRLTAQGIKARLHSAFINGQNCHRVLVLDIDGERYFADVGNGWPSVRLFPADSDSSYLAYGIEFSSYRNGDWLDIYQQKEGRCSLSVRIPLALMDEEQVEQMIQNRFDGSTEYPFDDGIRCAQVLGDAFVFLKRDRLRIFQSDKDVVTVSLPEWQDQIAALETRFGLTLSAVNVAEPTLCIGALQGRQL
ncbi:arylamine N-acetyltransferase [Thalassolituus hydrocarboniclasticus]|uniref:Arylamine N-acetyltransferase n=2 Tax=Thalassolituus hydrocarboniclasticus TaxID=2742796 RepID=A0ABY6AAI3_9GAMM|nr:arylamine N-acetyltransferase [Thalassolituus hydrocarboniclasticus]